jgi:hypothetical protein
MRVDRRALNCNVFLDILEERGLLDEQYCGELFDELPAKMREAITSAMEELRRQFGAEK